MPTREWKAATSCGIDVIATRRAMIAPIVPPTITPPPIRPSVTMSSSLVLHSVARVTATAMAIPTIPIWLPRRLVTGLESPRSARMNSTPQAR